MNHNEFLNIWNYYLILEADLSNTSRFVEPTQKNVFSFEFLKIIILASSELETAFKYLCKEITKESKDVGDIKDYKGILLHHYPKIIEAEVTITRLQENISPFKGWDNSQLEWWNAYQAIKHKRGSSFEKATYHNAVYALSALYLLIFYLSDCTGFQFNSHASKYITSEYSPQSMVLRPSMPLPTNAEP